MYCKECGKELPDGSVFCPDCGAQQTPGPAASETPAAPASAAAGKSFLSTLLGLSKRSWALLLLALGLINFILPFVKVPSLNTDNLFKSSGSENYCGLELMTTIGVRANALLTDGGESKNRFNIFAIASFVLAVVALVKLYKGKKSKTSGILSACAAGTLLLMIATFGSFYSLSVSNLLSYKVSANPGIGLVCAMLFFLGATAFCFLDKGEPETGFPFVNVKPADPAVTAAAAVQPVTDAASGAVDAVKDTASDAVDAAKDAASDAVDAVKDTASDAVDAVKDTASDAVDAVKDAASGAVDEVKDTASGAVDAVKDTASDAVDSAKDAVSDAADAAADAASELKN